MSRPDDVARSDTSNTRRWPSTLWMPTTCLVPQSYAGAAEAGPSCAGCHEPVVGQAKMAAPPGGDSLATCREMITGGASPASSVTRTAATANAVAVFDEIHNPPAGTLGDFGI